MSQKEKPVIIQVQGFLSKRWYFRYNEVLGRTEFKFKNESESDYRVLFDYDLNSIHLELAEKNIMFNIESLRKLLNSKFVKKYNPFQEYLNNLPVWNNETDFIDMLASTVETTNNDFFKFAFKKWFVAMVASLSNDSIVNQTFLIFTGEQGVGKTTWIQNLVPQELKEYYYSGAINPSNKDDKIQLAENMLINIDELQGMRASSIEELKALITVKEIKVRRPYGSIHETLPHRASFAGSVNQKEFLTDMTGNRRFLCFETESIQKDIDIPLDMVYAQALDLYKSGFRYWFDSEEIQLLNDSNEEFTKKSLEEELLLKYIEKGKEGEEDTRFGNATAILKDIMIFEEKLKLDDRTVNKIGRMLNKNKFTRAKEGGIYGYYYKINPDALGYGYHDPK